MLNHELQHRAEILVIDPKEPLDSADFTTLVSCVDDYLQHHGRLRSVLIRAESFPGWKDFGTLLAHLTFVKEHHQNIEKVAVVADGASSTVMPKLANHFLHAQVQRFDSASENAAWEWLRQKNNSQSRSAA